MQKKEGPPQPPALGRAGVVEELISQGRIPDFSPPTTKVIDGSPKKVVICTIPPQEAGQEPIVLDLFPPNAKQIKRRVDFVRATG